MKKLLLLLTFVVYFACCNNVEEVPYTTTLTGEVTGFSNSSYVILSPLEDDCRISGGINIEITDGRFEYTFTHDDIKKYELIMEENYNKGWVHRHFYSEPGRVHVKIFPDDEDVIFIVDGGKVNIEHDLFLKKTNEKFDLISIQEEMVKFAGRKKNT
ncbi:MAG: DUF4369 domain-containing protein [Rikenellaceae bacterium]|nr:DUF4369 domain-containing protein [Rikenellaceae bacterium]